MISRRAAIASFAAVASSAQPASAQLEHRHGSPPGALARIEVDALVDSVRRAVRPYHDRRAAIREGYRRVGRDFPGMGQHWVKPSLLLRKSFDAARPAILTYLDVNGTPMLTGVVFAVAVDSAGSPPTVPGSAGMWHDHNGTIDDESLQPGDTSAAGDRRRLTVLHVWTEVSNPAGIYATDNWALPFVRLGIAPPDAAPSEAGRALSLLTSAAYYVDRFVAAGADRAAISALIDARALVVAPIASRMRNTSAASPEDVAELIGEWTRFADAARALCAGCAGLLHSH